MRRAGMLLAAMLPLMVLTGPSTMAHHARFHLEDALDGEDFRPEGGLFYKMNDEQKHGRAHFQHHVHRHGRRTLELSVVPSCTVSGTECSERAEVWERPNVLAPYDQPLWYAFSMKLADPVPREMHRLVMAQWKREILKGAEGNYSPFLALRLLRGKLAITVVSDQAQYAPREGERAQGCKPGEAPANRPDEFKQVRALVGLEGGNAAAAAPGCATNIRLTERGGPVPSADSGWIDFVFLVKPDPRGAGAIEIIANGKWVASVEGAIGHEGPGLADTQYFKFGPYRAGRPDNWTIYFSDFKRSSRCIDVAPAALCQEIAEKAGRS